MSNYKRQVNDRESLAFDRFLSHDLRIDRAHPSCPESGSLCSTKAGS